MQVIVEGKEMQVTPALKEHALRQARKVSKVGDKILLIRVFLETIKKKRNDPTANVVTYTVEMPGANAVVSARAADMYEAITKATDAAARRVRKELDKIRTLHRSPSIV